jgi:hypothetical protein
MGESTLFAPTSERASFKSRELMVEMKGKGVAVLIKTEISSFDQLT